MNRNVRTPQASAEPTAPSQSASAPDSKKKTSKFKRGSKWGQIASFAFFLALTVLVVGAVLILALNDKSDEKKLVDNSKLQAVFLDDNNQVYFGKITDLNNDFVKITNVYYIRTKSNTTQTDQTKINPGDITLVKLGCDELHKPNDAMVISKKHIVFWENLKSDGQVAKAVADNASKNPKDGCSASASSTDSSTNSSTTAPATTNTNTNNSSTANPQQSR